MLRCSTQGLGLLHNVSYGLDNDLGLFGGHHVPAAGLDEFAKFGSGGQINLKLMPIDPPAAERCFHAWPKEDSVI